MDMKNFLCPLRRLSPTAPANSAAKQQPQTHSRGRARRNSHDENFTTILLLEFVSVLSHLLDGTVCHAVRRVNG